MTEATPRINSTLDQLTATVKAYDVRGLVGTELSYDIVEALAAGFIDEISGAGHDVIVGYDMRDSSPEFARAFTSGATARGANVVSIGLCSTDESYFASGHLGAGAAMFTASHNPAAYNGIKFSRAGAQSLSLDTGLAAIRDRAAVYLTEGITPVATVGTESARDILADYAQYLRSMVPLESVRPLKIVVDAGNGMGGLTVPAVLGTAAGLSALPLEIVPMYFELDGNFPNHEANPLDPKNLVDLQKAVVEHGADLGLAFDGDADRCFVIDERGEAVTPSAVAAIVALREINRVRASDNAPDEIVVLHNLITSRIVPEMIQAAGATAIRTKVGHSLIKDEMRATGAIFGGEHSAHYYFRDFWSADNGMLAAMHVIAELGNQGEKLSQLAAQFAPYSASGEINSTVKNVPEALARVVDDFAHEASFDEFDGLTVTGNTSNDDDFWWFSVRPSNTEPLLRLNVEASKRSSMELIRDRVLGLIRA